MHQTRIAFIGAGNMASSLIRGLLAKDCPPQNISAADVDSDKLDALCRECGIRGGSNDEIVAEADVVVLAVKPQVMQQVCRALSLSARPPLFVSVAAGITLTQLQAWLGGKMGRETAIVRCMPNTPALVGMGATGLFANARVSDTQRDLATSLLGSVGISVWVDSEADLDAVTAVSGSGPAYFFLLMEAMENAARELGLKADVAATLVLQTAAGAAELARNSDVDVAELRRRVTSPGGTTERAIETFEAGGLRELTGRALAAARTRSEELAKESDDN